MYSSFVSRQTTPPLFVGCSATQPIREGRAEKTEGERQEEGWSDFPAGVLVALFSHHQSYKRSANTADHLLLSLRSSVLK